MFGEVRAFKFDNITTRNYTPRITCSFEETWSLTLTREQTLTVSENKMLRSIFGSTREKIAGYRNLYNEELHHL
jgi:hypothetical protein